ncbi:MAG: ABC transporter ATP-binding protein [Armatimonadetes bacterium]|nr:ABC transporter ATP-binding protein [Armatimonadota bacterium]
MRLPFQQYRDLFASYLKHQWPGVALLAALVLGSIGLQLVNPQIMRFFIDTATSGGAPGRLTAAALLFMGVALVDQAASVGATYLGENLGWTATNKLRADLAHHCLRLDMSFHKARTPGEMIERLDGDVTVLANFFSQFGIRLLSNTILLFGVLALLFREDWRIGLPLTGFAVLALITLNRVRGVAVPHWVLARQASADFFGFLEERLSGIEDIRASGATAYVMRRFFQLLRERLHKERKAGLMGSVMGATITALFTLGHALAFAVGAWLFLAGTITIGTVFLITRYTSMLLHPLMQISHQIEDLQKASASIARIQEIYHTHSKIQDGPGAPFPSGALSVEFRRVSFAYDAGDAVLHNLSFSLAPGRTLGLLGRTGSGKTTLARLLFRLYDPTAGVIRLGSVDIRAARLAHLRQRVGMVTQDVQLFRGTVRDNLALFDRSVSDDQILQVLQQLGLWEWYRSLSQGLDTELESGGGGLSAGEAQLLAFTRVFLRDPGLVILDEASSRLDPATEQLIERAVDRLLRHRTGIIIAHRLATIHRADEIMILEDGHIREHGPREQLVSDPTSRFSNLLQTGLEEALV